MPLATFRQAIQIILTHCRRLPPSLRKCNIKRSIIPTRDRTAQHLPYRIGRFPPPIATRIHGTSSLCRFPIEALILTVGVLGVGSGAAGHASLYVLVNVEYEAHVSVEHHLVPTSSCPVLFLS